MADDRVREVKINLKRLRYFVKHKLYFFLNERWKLLEDNKITDRNVFWEF
jgi:hypothetical protein